MKKKRAEVERETDEALKATSSNILQYIKLYYNNALVVCIYREIRNDKDKPTKETK
jgi:hypothetical protein